MLTRWQAERPREVAVVLKWARGPGDPGQSREGRRAADDEARLLRWSRLGCGKEPLGHDGKQGCQARWTLPELGDQQEELSCHPAKWEMPQTLVQSCRGEQARALGSGGDTGHVRLTCAPHEELPTEAVPGPQQGSL